MTPSRVEWHLENWSTWQRSYHIGLGMPGRASCMASTGLTDFQDMCEAGDSYAARRYALNRGVPARMFELAVIFESGRKK